MNHHERRWLLHDAVEQLEPAAHSAAIREHFRRHHGMDLPLLRIYVDLERLVASGYLSRQRKGHPLGDSTTFFWETTNKVLVKMERLDPRLSSAAAQLMYRRPELTDAIAGLRTATSATTVLHETA